MAAKISSRKTLKTFDKPSTNVYNRIQRESVPQVGDDREALEMGQRYYRIQEAEDDWADILDPAGWVSTLWAGEGWLPCPKCGGTGTVTVYPSDDPEDWHERDCRKCGGTGQLDDSTRRGVSVCASLEDLYLYFCGRHAELTDRWVVELEGRESEEEDWDAADGAVLIYPTKVVSVTPLDPEEIYRREESIYGSAVSRPEVA